MKISSVLSYKDSILLKKYLPHINLDIDYTEDEWDAFIDDVQDEAAELLQTNDELAIEFDALTAKLSEFEY